MAFIEKADLLNYIGSEELDGITGGDDAKLTVPIDHALSVVRGKLNHRYDMVTVFANPNESNYYTIKKIATDIAIYFLYQTVQSRHIPEMRETAYQEADKWLHDLATGAWENDLPKHEVDEGEVNSGEGFATYNEFKPTDY